MQTISRRKKENEFLPAFRMATIIMRAFDPMLLPALFVYSTAVT